MTIKHSYPSAWPTVNFDFANSKALDPRITFTRSSVGTYTDANGILQYASDDEPRFDHDPVTGESLGLLIEEARTNTLTHSAEFDNAAWSVDGSSITADVQTSPDGTLTADKLVENASTGNHIVYDTTPVIKANPSFSCFAKAAERNFINLRLINSGQTGRAYATFDLTDGSVTDQGTIDTFFTGVQVQSESVGNSWYRLSISASSPSSTVRVSIGVSDAAVPTRTSTGGAPSYTGDGTSGVYIWGAQHEQGSFPTSYIPTSGAPVDRSPDLASITGTNFSSWYNQTEGSFTYDVNVSSGSAGIAELRINGESAGRGRFTRDSYRHFMRLDGSGAQVNGYIEYPNGFIKLAYRMQPGDHQQAINGVIANNYAGGNFSDPLRLYTEMRLGLSENLTKYLNGHISRFSYYPLRLSDEQLVALTS